MILWVMYMRCVAIPWRADRQRGREKEESSEGGGVCESDEERIKDTE